MRNREPLSVQKVPPQVPNHTSQSRILNIIVAPTAISFIANYRMMQPR
jgi:hypothetical protein